MVILQETINKYFSLGNVVPLTKGFSHGEDSDKILKILVLVIVHGTFDREQRKHDNIKADIKFDVLCEKESITNYVYHFLSEQDLCDVSHPAIVRKLKICALERCLDWEKFHRL
jgi:hypothetical protein